MTPGNVEPTGLAAFVAERIGSLDRRVEQMGRDIHARIDRQTRETKDELQEIKQMHEKAEDARDAEEDDQDARISDIERTMQMVKGGILVISAILTAVLIPVALVFLDHLLH